MERLFSTTGNVSGFSDMGIDVGCYIVDAMYEFDEAKKFIRAYLGEDWTDQKEFYHMAYGNNCLLTGLYGRCIENRMEST